MITKLGLLRAEEENKTIIINSRKTEKLCGKAKDIMGYHGAEL